MESLNRFPQADKEGDGVLSIKEQQTVIRQSAARAKRNGGQKSDAPEGKVHIDKKEGNTGRALEIFLQADFIVLFYFD